MADAWPARTPATASRTPSLRREPWMSKPVFDPAGNTTHRDDPYPLYKSLRDNDPVVWDPQLGAYVVSRFHTIAAVMSDSETYSSYGSLGMSPDSLEPELQEILAKGDRLGE